MDILFVIITGLIAWHGLTFKSSDGKKDFVRLLFGAISTKSIPLPFAMSKASFFFMTPNCSPSSKITLTSAAEIKLFI